MAIISLLGNVIERFQRKFVFLWPNLAGYKIPVKWIESIDVEPTAHCNLGCPFCQVPGWERAEYTRAMTLETFKTVIDQFPGLKRVKLQGMGEPFLNKQLPDFISYCTGKGITSHILTNGTVMHKALREKIIDSGLTEIWFSFDGATKGTYESLRIGAKYESTLDNIRRLCVIRDEKRSSMKIGMICLVSNEEVLREIPDYVQMAFNAGVRNIEIKGRLKEWKKIGSEGKYVIGGIRKVVDYDEFERYIPEAIRLAKKLGVNFRMVQHSYYSASKPCPWPWRSCFVSAEGKIVPCCVIGVPETWNMGDLMKENMSTIWNNLEYREFRKDMKENNIRELCKACYGMCNTYSSDKEKELKRLAQPT